MIWKEKNPKPQRKHRERYTDKVFCLFPMKVEGYTVWLESVHRSREWFHEGSFKFWVWDSAQYTLTESQKEKLGLTW